MSPTEMSPNEISPIEKALALNYPQPAIDATWVNQLSTHAY